MTRPLGDDVRHALRDTVTLEGRGTVPYGWAQLVLYHRGPDFPLGIPRQECLTATSDTTHRSVREAYPGSRTQVLTEGFVGPRKELHGLRQDNGRREHPCRAGPGWPR